MIKMLFWLGVLAGIVRVLTRVHARRISLDHMDRFPYDGAVDRYEPAIPQAWIPRRSSTVVLFLHGYSASPGEYRVLFEALRKQKIAYVAPRLPGFGVRESGFLEVVTAADWLRAADEAYRQAAALGTKVIVVGHSNGGNLALQLAARHNIERLVLLAPNMFVAAKDARTKARILDPVFGPLIRWVYPWFAKPHRAGRVACTDTLEPLAATHAYHQPALPLRSLEALWRLQDDTAQLQGISAPTLLVYGSHDASINPAQMRDWFGTRNIPLQIACLENSAHNVLEDYEKEAAAEIILRGITEGVVPDENPAT